MNKRNAGKKADKSTVTWIITALLAALLVFMYADTIRKERIETARLEEVFNSQVNEEKQQMQEREKEKNEMLLKEQNDSFYQRLADGFDVRILVTGGSIGNGRGSSDADHTWHTLLKNSLEEKYGITAEVDSIAMNDNMAYAGYVSLRNHESEDPYDLVIISYGEDDPAANFDVYYEALIRSAMEKYPDASVICVPESTVGTATANTGVVDAITEMYGIPSAPTVEAFSGQDGLLNEEGYPGNEGQKVISEAIVSVISEGVSEYRGKDSLPAERYNEASAYLNTMEYYPADLFTRDGNTYTMNPSSEITGKVIGIDYNYVTGYNHSVIYISGQWDALGQAVFTNGLTYEDEQSLNSSGERHIRVMNNWISDWGTYNDELFTFAEEIQVSFPNDESGTKQADGFRGIIVSSLE